jgi:membrane-bound lytic murein transglycosylase
MSKLSETLNNDHSDASSSSSTSSLHSSPTSSSPSLSFKHDSKNDLTKTDSLEPELSNSNNLKNTKSKKQKTQDSYRGSKNPLLQKEMNLENTQNLLTSSDSTTTTVSDSYEINISHYPDVNERVEVKFYSFHHGKL